MYGFNRVVLAMNLAELAYNRRAIHGIFIMVTKKHCGMKPYEIN